MLINKDNSKNCFLCATNLYLKCMTKDDSKGVHMKTRLLKLSKFNTILISIIMVSIYIGSTYAWATIYDALVQVEVSQYTYHMLQEGFDSIVAILFLFIVGYQSVLKQKGEGFRNGVYICGFLFVYILYRLMLKGYVCILNPPGEMNPIGEIVAFTMTMFLVGITEEVMMRGVILNLLLDRFSNTQRGIWTAVIIESAMFGAFHIGNVFIGANLDAVFWQIVSATMTGILLSAIYVRCNNIWILIVAHALYDFMALISSGIYGLVTKAQFINNGAGPNWFVYLLMLIPAIILLRRKKLQEVMIRREQGAECVQVIDSKTTAHSESIKSILFGIFSIAVSWTGIFWICGIMGILAARVSMTQKQNDNKLAKVGLIISIIGTVLGIVCAVGLIIYFLSMGYFDKVRFYQKWFY